MTKSFLLGHLLLFCLIVLPVPAFAVSQMAISQSGNGVFVVTGKFDNLAGFHITVNYDGTMLSNPRVANGDLVSGMIVVPNTGANPIQIVGGGLKNVNGSGTVVVLTFDAVGSSPGGITGFSGYGASYIKNSPTTVRFPFVNNAAPVVASNDPSGSGNNNQSGSTTGSGSTSGTSSTGDTAATPPPATTNQNANTPTPTSSTTQTTTTTQTVRTTSGQPYVGGTVTLPPADAPVPSAGSGTAGATGTPPADQQAPSPRTTDRPAPASEVAQADVPAPKAAPAQPAAPPKPMVSVLERFRLFEGEATVKSATALFDRDAEATFVQTPAIAMADGKNTVKVVVSKVTGNKAPSFSFSGARYVSLEELGDGEWEVVVKPDSGAVKASVKMFTNGVMQEFPLTVAPKTEAVLDKGSEVAEADFAQFLKERGTASAPKLDLNGDGKRDYVDDYIYTANYLVKIAEKKKSKTSAAQKQ